MAEPDSFPKLVRDLMTVGVATCSPEASIPDIARLFIERYLEIIVVIDPVDGHAIGVISQDELIKAYAQVTVRRRQRK